MHGHQLLKANRALQRRHQNIVLASPVSVPYQRKTEQPASYFLGTALREMLAVAGLEKPECDGLMVSSYSLAPDTAVSLAETFDISLNWIEQVQLGGASGIVGVRRAARAVAAGDADVIACVGGDTFMPDQFAGLLGRFSSFTIDGSTPYGCGGASVPFALLTRAYMEAYDATREDFGRLCILQRKNAQAYQQALLRESLTMQAYLSARLVSEPLGLFDCVMPCAGAEGVLVMQEGRAQALGIPYVRLLASAERHNASRGMAMPLTFGWRDFREDLYQAAKLRPEQMDIVQVYDDYPVMALLQLEELGFCQAGQASRYLTEASFMPHGRVVHLNTSGGQLSAGQAGFAGGFMGLTEAVRQLTDKALGNQLSEVKNALISGFGMINYNRGLCATAAIIERAEL